MGLINDLAPDTLRSGVVVTYSLCCLEDLSL
jgi:hypothetical protein